MRIYIDEAGTHGHDWLVIGMLFVPDHGSLHNALCKIKDEETYFNKSPKHAAKYKETHLKEFKSERDARMGCKWVDAFFSSSAYFRCVVVDWSIWEGKYFGGCFEPEALKKRRAYKKWAEMLLQPEVSSLRGAELYLDQLLVCNGYDVLENLEDRFRGDYRGQTPWISKFQTAESWKDAHQCLQLADLLVGCVYRNRVRPTAEAKAKTIDYLYDVLERDHGVKARTSGFWTGYAANSLTKHFPKFSEWYWRPTK